MQTYPSSVDNVSPIVEAPLQVVDNSNAIVSIFSLSVGPFAFRRLVRSRGIRLAFVCPLGQVSLAVAWHPREQNRETLFRRAHFFGPVL